MRCIGLLPNSSQAERFSLYLYNQDIENQVDQNSSGQWEIWVLDEDLVSQAKSLFESYSLNPEDASFTQGARSGQNKKTALEQSKIQDRSRMIDARTQITAQTQTMGWVTISLIVISIAVSVLTRLGNNEDFILPLQITEHQVVDHQYIRYDTSLPEIRHGQIWRLFTPMFLHFGLLHILFNMLWMRELGSIIESIQGSWYLFILTLSISVVSNLAQFFMSGPGFGGMSGVVFGLIGYMWMHTKFNPGGRIRLSPQTVQFSVIWFILCLTGLVGNIANTVHGVGAAMGIAWGYISAKHAAHRGQ